MAFASAQASINTLLKIFSLTSPNNPATIGNMNDIQGPGFSAAVVDVTSHSTAVPWRSKITTLLDPGDLTSKVFFIPSSPGTADGSEFGHNFSSGLGSVFTNRTLREYSITFPDTAATTWYIQAYVSKTGITASVAGVLEMGATWTLTGQPQLI